MTRSFGRAVSLRPPRVRLTNFFVGLLASNNVSVIDTTTNTVAATVGAGSAPYTFGVFIATEPRPPKPTDVRARVENRTIYLRWDQTEQGRDA